MPGASSKVTDPATSENRSTDSQSDAAAQNAANRGSPPGFIPLNGVELEVSLALRKKGYSAKATEGHVAELTASKEAPDIHLFKEFPYLEQVNLNTTTLEREEFVKLNQLTDLKSLGLSRTNVQDDWLTDLSGMRSLENLYLSETQITNAAIEHLLAFPTLKMVNLNQTEVTDDGMPGLAEHPSLEILYVVQTNFSDAGLAHLQASKSLKQIYVKWTRVTEQGIEGFRQANPTCEVFVD